MEDKNLFRKVVQRDEFYLSQTYYDSVDYDSHLNKGYYEKVTFNNGTHLWYTKELETGELKHVFNQRKIETLNEFYFKAVDESSF